MAQKSRADLIISSNDNLGSGNYPIPAPDHIAVNKDQEDSAYNLTDDTIDKVNDGATYKRVTAAEKTNLAISLVLKGNWDASSGSFPGGGATKIGDTWRVSVAGTQDGKTFAVDDMVTARIVNASTSTYAANWRADLAGSGGVGDASTILMARIGASTYSTVQHLQDVFHSSGLSSGGGVTGAGSNTIDVAAGTGFIRTLNDKLDVLKYFDWAALAGGSVPSDATRFVGVEYNAGSPQVTIRTTNNFNNHTDFLLATCVNEAGIVYLGNTPHAVGDHANFMIQRSRETMGIQRDNITKGLILGETGTRNITLTLGNLWDRLAKFAIGAKNTSVSDSFDRYFRDGGGGFTKQSAQTQWDNAQFDDGTGTLATLGVNKYAVQWFYVSLDGDLICLFGTASHNSLAEAEDEAPPALAPDRVTELSILVAKLIFKKSDATAEAIESSFSQQFGGAVVTDHAGLAGLGGDDHAQYALLAGRASGQTIIGGTASSEELVLRSTSHATKGAVKIEGAKFADPDDATKEVILVASSVAPGASRNLSMPDRAVNLEVGKETNDATSKVTPVDADEIPLSDSADTNFLKKLTWANLKATLKTYFDTLYAALAHTHTSDEVTGTVVVEATTTRTLSAADDNKIILCTHASGCTITVFAATVGFTCTIVRPKDAADVTITDDGTRLIYSVAFGADTDFVLEDEHQMTALAYLATNEFYAQ